MLQIQIFLKSTTFSCKTQDFSASSQICWKGPFCPDTTRPKLGTLPWPSTCVLRWTTRRNRVTASWLSLTASWLTPPPQQCGTDSRGAFSVGGHVPARILGPAAVKIAAIQFHNWFCAPMVLICVSLYPRCLANLRRSLRKVPSLSIQ